MTEKSEMTDESYYGRSGMTDEAATLKKPDDGREIVRIAS